VGRARGLRTLVAAMPPRLRPDSLDRAASWAVSNASAELLQSIRDEVGRLNQRALVRDDMAVDVTVNGREPRGYVSVARCRNGQGGGF